ncbi:MAG: hypothetical protein AAF267_15285 [Deinococcota bacterium]
MSEHNIGKVRMSPLPTEQDPFDESHYQDISSFAALLISLGYQASLENQVLEVKLSDEHPGVGYELANYVLEAQAHGICTLESHSLEGDIFTVALEAAEQSEPLYKRVTYPIDYFHAIEGVTQIALRFDFDTLEGIDFTSLLMDNSQAYVDYNGSEGPVEDFEASLKEIDPAAWAVLEAVSDERYATLILDHWLNYFDFQFSFAQMSPEDYIILHCVGPHDKGYEGDKMYFLMAKDIYEQLEIPASYTARLN